MSSVRVVGNESRPGQFAAVRSRAVDGETLAATAMAAAMALNVEDRVCGRAMFAGRNVWCVCGQLSLNVPCFSAADPRTMISQHAQGLTGRVFHGGIFLAVVGATQT